MGRGGLKNLRDPGGGLDGLAQGKCLGDRQGASSQSPDSDHCWTALAGSQGPMSRLNVFEA
jgi:hypothetical protein